MNGDVCNKIGTYLKAISAYENNIPFYVALPTSTIDRNLKNGSHIPIEIRDGKELSDLIFEKSKKHIKFAKKTSPQIIFFSEKTQNLKKNPSKDQKNHKV